MVLEQEIRRLLKRIFWRELRNLHFAFPAVVLEYLGPHPDPYGQTATPGVLKARALIRPKYKLMKENGEVVEMPTIWNVPVSWYKMGDFLYRFPLKKGDIVLCVVSERALDEVLKNREYEHVRYKGVLRLEDAVVLPFGLRMDSDPLTPDEYTDCLYIAAVEGSNIVAKFIMTPDGTIRLEGKRVEIITPDLRLVDTTGPNVARVGDSCCGTIHEGSPSAICADTSSYAPTPWAETGIIQKVPFLPPQFTIPGASVGLPNAGQDDATGLSLVEYCLKKGKELGLIPKDASDKPYSKMISEALEKEVKKTAGEAFQKGQEKLEEALDKHPDESWGDWAWRKVASLFQGGGGEG